MAFLCVYETHRDAPRLHVLPEGDYLGLQGTWDAVSVLKQRNESNEDAIKRLIMEMKCKITLCEQALAKQFKP